MRDGVKIAVYGATGMVGAQIVKESLQRGHEVTAVSRSGA
ncbi:NAD-dependent epimerase/dehydratase family protein [Arthrobacter sp. B10-11]|nr:NAD-dependent epimerase/dehydratase family protein [Arthrobacter sp. B10-11]MDV8147938.1 NAD-dependent epimerase/dehydratase family protein [Arthrobacter sp. B10-11]